MQRRTFMGSAVASLAALFGIKPALAATVPAASKPAEPDFVYDPDDWEYTQAWEDRADLAECVFDDRSHRDDVKQFATLINGPDKFAAYVPISFDENGEPDERQLRWFDSEAEAREALGLPRYMTQG